MIDEKTTPCVACGYPSTLLSHAPVNGFTFHRCEQCTLVFIPLSQFESTMDYDELYTDNGLYSVKFSEASGGELPCLNRTRRHAIDEIKKIGPKTALEIGCGTGTFLKRLQLMGIDCAGVEPSSKAAEMARTVLNVPIENEFFSSGSFAGQKFDAIFVWEVIEHVHDLKDFVENINNLLVPGGYLFMSTPNYESSWMWNDMPLDPMSAPPVHVTFWNMKAYTKFLDSAFDSNSIKRYSAPLGAAQRSGIPLARYWVYLDALLRVSNRTTLASISRKRK